MSVSRAGGPRVATPAAEPAGNIPASKVDQAAPIAPAVVTDSRSAQRFGFGAHEPSKVFALLGKERFVEVPAVRVPAKIAWVNFELAKALGFPVPESRQMTKELEEALLSALAFRVLQPGEDPAGRETLTLFADRYKGTGMAKNEGSGRAAFLPTRNLHIKGVGQTPLVKSEGNDFTHSHGGAPMREGFLEAIWGQVGDNLFTHGSTQVVAVIDAGDSTVWADGTHEKRALIIRAGRQLRPAHLMTSLFGAGTFGVDAFLRGVKDSGDLVSKNGVPDLAATMKKVIARHALTSAEQYRYRVLHGAISTSNLELDGSQLDLGTQTAQPRTAPIRVLAHGSKFGAEHEARASELQFVYDALRNTLPAREKKRLNAAGLDVKKLLDAAYKDALDVQLVAATGLTPPLAAELAKATELPKVLQALAKLSHVPVADADKTVSEKDAVVDVFALLREFPRAHFSGADKETLTARAFELLQPVFAGGANDAMPAHVRELSGRFVDAYAKLMDLARGKAKDPRAFERQVTHRAAFENAPLDRLYRARLNEQLIAAIAEYERSSDPTVFKDAVDASITHSLRSVDRLLTQGATKGPDSQMRTIAGIDYAVRAQGDDRSLRVSLPLSRVEGGARLTSIAGAPVLSEDQLAGLRYRFTTDDWRSGPQEAPARIESDALVFDIPMLPSEVGRLEGVFYAERGAFWIKDRAKNFSGYVFAVPE